MTSLSMRGFSISAIPLEAACAAVLAESAGLMRDGGSLTSAADAARRGAETTAQVGVTASGRSAYVPSAHLLGVTDPGAEAIAVILGAMAAA